jgi:hypothetical protein
MEPDEPLLQKKPTTTKARHQQRAKEWTSYKITSSAGENSVDGEPPEMSDTTLGNDLAFQICATNRPRRSGKRNRNPQGLVAFFLPLQNDDSD